MPKPTHRPYTPFGAFNNKKDASNAAKGLPWPAVPCKSSINGYSLVRKDKK